MKRLIDVLLKLPRWWQLIVALIFIGAGIYAVCSPEDRINIKGSITFIGIGIVLLGVWAFND